MGAPAGDDRRPGGCSACCAALRAYPGRLLFLLAVLDLAAHSVCLSRLSANTFLREVGLPAEPPAPAYFPCPNSTNTTAGGPPPPHAPHTAAGDVPLCPDITVRARFALGGSTVDLWACACARCYLVLLTAVVVTCGFLRHPLTLWRAGLAVLVGSGAFLVYVVVKCLVRLVDGPGVGTPGVWWFWGMVAAAVCAMPAVTQQWLYFLHDYIEHCEQEEAGQRHRGSSMGSSASGWAGIQSVGGGGGGRHSVSSSSSPLAAPLLTSQQLDAALIGVADHHAGRAAEDGAAAGSKRDGDAAGGDNDDSDSDDASSDDEDDVEDEKREFLATGAAYSGTVGVALFAREERRRRGRGGRSLAWFRPPARTKKKKSAVKSASVKKLVKLALPDTAWLLVAFVALLVAAVGQSMIPYLTGNIINEVAGGQDIEELRRATTLLTVTAAVTAVFTALRGSIFTLTMAKLNVRVRNAFFRSLLCQELGFFDTIKTGDITSRLSADTTKMSDQISLNVNVFIRSVVQACGVLFFMFRLSVKLSVVTFCSVPAVVVLSKVYGAYYRTLTKRAQKKLASANAVADEALGAMQTVKSFAAEEAECRDYAARLEKYYDVNKHMAVAYTVYAVMFTVLPNLVTALVLFYGGKLVIEGALRPGDLVSFMLFQQNLSSAFNTIGNIWTGISGALGAADKVFEYIGREPKIKLEGTPEGLARGRAVDLRRRRQRRGDSGGDDAAGGRPASAEQRLAEATGSWQAEWGKPPGDSSAGAHGGGGGHGGEKGAPADGATVDLVACHLRYPSRPEALVLCGVTVRVSPGEVVALVGPSGGGKSSCLRLINRLYTPQTGSVRLDGLSVHDYQHGFYHRRVSIVGQEPVLFARSIRRNILYGLSADGEGGGEGGEDDAAGGARQGAYSPPATMQDVVRAAKLSNAHDFIMAFPKQYMTQCGEKGVSLSGGQKQRVAIARALVRDPAVLLLDEATSALDTESEAVVQRALDDVMRTRSMTTIVVAHRLSTVQNANRIVVIDKGAVQEVGTHAELLAKGGVYRKLVQRQLQGGADDAAAVAEEKN